MNRQLTWIFPRDVRNNEWAVPYTKVKHFRFVTDWQQKYFGLFNQPDKILFLLSLSNKPNKCIFPEDNQVKHLLTKSDDLRKMALYFVQFYTIKLKIIILTFQILLINCCCILVYDECFKLLLFNFERVLPFLCRVLANLDAAILLCSRHSNGTLIQRAITLT